MKLFGVLAMSKMSIGLVYSATAIGAATLYDKSRELTLRLQLWRHDEYKCGKNIHEVKNTVGRGKIYEIMWPSGDVFYSGITWQNGIHWNIPFVHVVGRRSDLLPDSVKIAVPARVRANLLENKNQYLTNWADIDDIYYVIDKESGRFIRAANVGSRAEFNDIIVNENINLWRVEMLQFLLIIVIGALSMSLCYDIATDGADGERLAAIDIDDAQ